MWKLNISDSFLQSLTCLSMLPVHFTLISHQTQCLRTPASKWDQEEVLQHLSYLVPRGHLWQADVSVVLCSQRENPIQCCEHLTACNLFTYECFHSSVYFFSIKSDICYLTLNETTALNEKQIGMHAHTDLLTLCIECC